MFFLSRSRSASTLPAPMRDCVGTAEFAPDGRILAVSAFYGAMLGYAPADLIGQTHSLIAPQGEDAGMWEAVLSGETRMGEFRRRGRAGQDVWLRGAYAPAALRSGKATRIAAFGVDVTEDKRREAEMKAKLDALARVQAIIEFDPEGRILEANEAFLAATGYRLEEIVGRHHSLFVDPQQAQSPDYAAFWRRLAQGESSPPSSAAAARTAGNSGCKLPTIRCAISMGAS